MRRDAVALALALAACGDNRVGHDAKPAIDARMIDAAHPDAGTACRPTRGTTLAVRAVAHASGPLTDATAPDGDPRLFVVEKSGAIRIFAHGVLGATPFLDLSIDAGGPVVALGDEQGLVGLAFDPGYATNRRLYVSYTTDTALAIVRYTASATDPDVVDLATAAPILTLALPTTIHHGGTLGFGADGRLEVGIGDGGIPANARAPGSLFGKLVAIDLANAGATAIVMQGLRNPWRWAFDRATGDLWLGDVGEDTEEEVDLVSAAAQPGADLGWPMYEGTHCATPPCDPTGLVAPVFTRTHALGWRAVIGGEVYRGRCFPDLVGTYLFSDLGSRQVMRATRDAMTGAVAVTQNPTNLTFMPTAIGHDGAGELYVTGTDGTLAHVSAAE